MRYKAIFFDRDGTLTYFDKKKETWRDQKISEWSGKPFELPYKKMMKLFALASEGRKPWYKNIDDEQEFFKRFYQKLLVGEGIKEKNRQSGRVVIQRTVVQWRSCVVSRSHRSIRIFQ